MIVTVTLNPAVDKTLMVRRFTVGKTNRGEIERLDPGGKGINVAKALQQLGSPVTAIGFVAGMNGRFIRRALEALKIPADFVDVEGETRINLKITDPQNATETEINESGFPVGPEDLARLKEKLGACAARAKVVVFSGSLPPGAPPNTYADLLAIARGQGAKTILDTSGAALAKGMEGRPDFVKPNRVEAEDLLRRSLGTRTELARAVRELLDMGPSMAAISMGAEGLVAGCRDRITLAVPPPVQARSSVGAGDALVAAFAYAMVEDLEFDAAVRLATAMGAATAAAGGSSVAGMDAVRALLPQIVLTRFDEGLVQ
jgi:1-phosphofructokinase